MSDKITHLTAESFTSAVGSSTTPLLVDFWAPWCGPCKAIAPILEELAVEYEGKLTIAKLNIDDYGDVAAGLEIRSIPTLLVFKGGALAARLVGMLPKAALKAKLAPLL